jgi:TonB family protein
MSDPRFRRSLKVSTAVHVTVLAALALWPLMDRLVHPPKPPEMITFVDLVSGSPAPPERASVVTPPEPKPETPVPEVKPPEPEKPIPVPEPKPEKPKIKVNTNKVVRKVDPAPPKPAPKPTLTKEQIARMLDSNVRFTSLGSGGGSTGGDASPLSIYYAQVRETMYGAWRQPSGAGASGIRAQVRIRVLRGGGIVSREMVTRSGSAVMDASVMTAVQSVSRLRPLPADVTGDSLDIVVEFVLEGP